MTAWRQAIELSIGDEDVARLVTITRSRTEPASRVERARMLLAYRENPSFFAVAHALGVHHQSVQRCVEQALAYGPMAALDDRPRSGKEPTIAGRLPCLEDRGVANLKVSVLAARLSKTCCGITITIFDVSVSFMMIFYPVFND